MSNVKVKGHTHLVRDLKSQAIINTDSDAYARYMARKAKQAKQRRIKTESKHTFRATKVDL